MFFVCLSPAWFSDRCYKLPTNVTAVQNKTYAVNIQSYLSSVVSPILLKSLYKSIRNKTPLSS